MLGKSGIKLKSFFAQCKRVWLILRKPSNAEFSSIAKVSAVGLLIIGAIGFAIAGVMQLFS
tara:strand:- start:132 stop:314 length:183 start_codon:yes stop_codon:yes gene_type:complete